MAIQFQGYAFQDDGDALQGATVQLLQVSDGAEEASTTTDSDGLWAFSEADEDRYDIKITSGSSVRFRKWADEMSVKAIDIRNNSANTEPALQVTNLTNNASNQVAVFSGANSTRAEGDEIYLSFNLADDGGTQHEFARLTAEATDVSNGSEDGQFRFGVSVAGTITDVFTIDSSTGGSTTMTLDVSGDLVLDADGGDILFKDGGTTFGSATNTSGNLIIKSGTTTALTFSGANATIAGDLTISGDDLTMGTNTDTAILVADGTNYNPVVPSGVIDLANDGAFTVDNTFISSQTEITSGLAAADELLYSDGGTIKKVGIDTLTTYLAGVNAGTVTSTGISDSSGVLTLDIQSMTASSTIADADLIVIDDGAGGTLRKMTRANFIESAALDSINIDGGAIDGAAIGANSATTIVGTTIDASTDFTIGDTVITDGTITDSTGLSIAAAVDLGSNTLTSTGSMQIRTIDYSDGDLAITIADGGGITAAAGITSTAAANTLGATSFNDANITNVGSIALDTITSDGSNVGFGTDGSGEDVYFYSATSGDHLFWDSSDEKLTITGTNGQVSLAVADGNVTIADNLDVDGTTNLDAVDIDGAVQLDAALTVGVDDTGYDVKLFGATSGNYMLWDESTDDLILAGSSRLHLNDAGGGEYLLSDGTDLTIASGAKINLTATSDVHVPANVGVVFGTGEKIEGDDTDLTLTSGGDIVLNATANVGIGNTNPGYPLTLNDGDGGWTVVVTQSTSGSSPGGIKLDWSASNPDNTATEAINFQDSDEVKFIVYGNGNVVNRNNSYGAASDVALKQDITDARDYTNDFKNVRFRKFRMKNAVASNSNAPYLLGVIAQEVDDVFPSLVEDGSMDGTTAKTFKYSVLNVIAMKVLQSLIARVEALEA